MKIGVISENLIEQFAFQQQLVPIPCIETQSSMILARVIIVATRLGVFEVLASEPLKLEDIAAQCNADPTALEALLDALVNTVYLLRDEDYYKLAPVAGKWLLRDKQHSLYDFISSRVVVWNRLTHLEEFIQTGQAIQMHSNMAADEWQMYHRSMRGFARIAAPEVAKYTPVPVGAKDMLDIGGSHGCFLATLCRRHQDLKSVILELPESIEYAATLLAEEDVGNRVMYKAGNAITDDLGTNAYDVVFMSNLIHHFDESTNIDLFRRVSKALRPGGCFVVQKLMFTDKEQGQGGAFLNLFFAMTSAGGNWSFKTIEQWQREAGLVPQKTIKFRTTPATGQQVAIKP